MVIIIVVGGHPPLSRIPPTLPTPTLLDHVTGITRGLDADKRPRQPSVSITRAVSCAVSSF